MPKSDVPDFNNVTYRASVAGGADVELHLALDPATATVQDAWNRLSAAFVAVDPATLEILIRQQRPAGLRRAPAYRPLALAYARAEV